MNQSRIKSPNRNMLKFITKIFMTMFYTLYHFLLAVSKCFRIRLQSTITPNTVDYILTKTFSPKKPFARGKALVPSYSFIVSIKKASLGRKKQTFYTSEYGFLEVNRPRNWLRPATERSSPSYDPNSKLTERLRAEFWSMQAIRYAEDRVVRASRSVAT